MQYAYFPTNSTIKQLIVPQSRLKSTVYVAGLDNVVNDKILADAFLPFGEIVDVTLPKPDLPSSKDPHRGFGYIEFEVPGDAKEAIDNMDQSELFRRVIKVAPAKPQKDSNEGLGSKTAVWEQASPCVEIDWTALIEKLGGLFGKTCCKRRRQTSDWARETGSGCDARVRRA